MQPSVPPLSSSRSAVYLPAHYISASFLCISCAAFAASDSFKIVFLASCAIIIKMASWRFYYTLLFSFRRPILPTSSLAPLILRVCLRTLLSQWCLLRLGLRGARYSGPSTIIPHRSILWSLYYNTASLIGLIPFPLLNKYFTTTVLLLLYYCYYYYYYHRIPTLLLLLYYI